MTTWNVQSADIMDWCASYEGEPYHALLADAPYEISFMKSNNRFDWDGQGVSFRPETWAAIAEHLYPGALLFVFAGSRTYHRIACAMEDAGLAIHQPISWLFGSGFPKSARIDTQIDKAAGKLDERESYERPIAYPDSDTWGIPNNSGYTVKRSDTGFGVGDANPGGTRTDTLPATPLAQTWAGHRYGITALKPMCELIAVAQKPYEGRPVDSITETGAGAYNIDLARLATGEDTRRNAQGGDNGLLGSDTFKIHARLVDDKPHPQGRWPDNVALSPEAASAMDEQAGERKSGGNGQYHAQGESMFDLGDKPSSRDISDSGSASRFFYNADWTADTFECINAGYGGLYTGKAARWEREAGVSSEKRFLATMGDGIGAREHNPEQDGAWARNPHPTIKPLTLTHWLASLLLPPPEYAPRRLLVPFAGVASEMIGALLAGWDVIHGVELMPEYVAVAEQRLAFWADFVDSGGDIADILERGKEADAKRRAQAEAAKNLTPMDILIAKANGNGHAVLTRLETT